MSVRNFWLFFVMTSMFKLFGVEGVRKLLNRAIEEYRHPQNNANPYNIHYISNTRLIFFNKKLSLSKYLYTM